MSQNEIAILAIIQPAPGKTDRLREVFTTAIHWIKANEPETLEFSLYEAPAEDGDGVTFSMVERYASQAAMIAHESTDNYKQFLQLMTEEKLLQCAPIIQKGTHSHGFRR